MLWGGMSMGRNRHKYIPEFRTDVVRLVREQGLSVADVVRGLDIHVNTLHGWMKAEADGLAPTVIRRSSGHEETTRLRSTGHPEKAAAFFAIQRRGDSPS
jgi:transposase-like protein